MNCTQAAECVSALFDGEPISRETAAHLSDCEECRARLNDYAEMGAELRDAASAIVPRTIPGGKWRLAEPTAANSWLKKWRGTMRIPRFAFALMLIAIFVLSGGLALVKARAGESGPVLLLTFSIPPKGETLDCAVRTDQGDDNCAFFKSYARGDLAVSARFIEREGERIRLGIKGRYQPWTSPSLERTVTLPVKAFDGMPQKEYWFVPNKPLSVPIDGLGNIQISGKFMGHVPKMVSDQQQFRWFQYELFGRDGKRIMSGTAPTNPGGNPYYDVEAGMSYPEGHVWFDVRVVEQVGETEKLSVRALWVPKGDGRSIFDRLHNLPEREFFYSPGQELKIPVEDYGNLEIKGHFEAKLPENVRIGLYPEDGVFRVSPPVVLVRGKEMLGKFDSGGGQVSVDKSYFAYGQRDEGWFVFSSKPFEGAVEGTLRMNQIEFTLDGRPYLVLTGDPILFGSVKIWVKHYDSIKDADPTSPGDGWQGNIPRLAFGELQNLATEK